MLQEKIDDFMAFAKYYAQAEKELEVQSWVHVSIEYTDPSRNVIRLFSYDLPREVFERREWVINWRMARLICQYPKAGVHRFVSYYDKRLGNDPKLTADLRTLVSAKAQVTKVQKRIEEYVAYHKENDIFFDESTDADLIAARQKLEHKIKGVAEAESRLKAKIEEIRKTKANESPRIQAKGCRSRMGGRVD